MQYRIKLASGEDVLVDKRDFDKYRRLRWCNVSGYATRAVWAGKYRQKRVLMHRLINNTPEGFDTDHINRNKLDNRRRNLRTVTQSINMLNSGVQRNNSSGYVGVTKLREGWWQARIMVDKKSYFLGRFRSPLNAHKARLAKEKELGLCTAN